MRRVSEILSVTGRDVPGMPTGRGPIRGWGHFLYPPVALVGALQHRDWPEVAVWAVTLVAFVVRVARPSTPRPWRARSLAERALIAATLAISFVMVFLLKNADLRWTGVVLLVIGFWVVALMFERSSEES